MPGLWGPSKDLDYWTARGKDLVPPEERRAMALLASITDEQRFSLYCKIGQMPALGNVTKRIYLVRRFDRVLELSDGRPSRSWCIGAENRYAIPETDHIVTMKNLIEGEELAFRETGNPSSSLIGTTPPVDGVVNPYAVPFCGVDDEARAGLDNVAFVDFMDGKKDFDRAMSYFKFQKQALEETIQEGPSALEDLLGVSARKRKRQEEPRIQIGGGLFGIPGQQMMGAHPTMMMNVGTNASTVPTVFLNGPDTITNGGVVQGCYYVGNGTQFGVAG